MANVNSDIHQLKMLFQVQKISNLTKSVQESSPRPFPPRPFLTVWKPSLPAAIVVHADSCDQNKDTVDVRTYVAGL